MKTFRVKFYRAKLGDGYTIDNLIDGYSFLVNLQGWKYPQLKTSHAGVWIPDDDNIYEIDDPGGFGETAWHGFFETCYTSTMGQARKEGAKYNGTCSRPASEVLYHPERWFYVQHDVHPEALKRAIKWADDEVGLNKGYDTWDITKYFNPFVRKQNLADHKFICSGFTWAFICKAALYWMAIDPKGYATSSLCRLFEHRHITDLPSPFRLALWHNAASCEFTDLATGQIIKMPGAKEIK